MRSIPIHLELPYCPATDGEAMVVDRGVGSRVLRALAALFGCFAGALVCIFIPLLHFILVPGLLISGITLFVLRLRDDCSLVEVRGACPRCKTPRVMGTSGRWSSGRSIHCDTCGEAPKLLAREATTQPALASP